MKRNGLPSLPGLHAFEAAARHLSFSLAAEEIGVTPTAVSHRIRALEAELGVQLFRRAHRSVLLTNEGEQVARDLAESFDCMRVSVARLNGRWHQRLTIAVEDAFAVYWLLPRLATFRSQHAGITIRIDPLRGLDFEKNEADAAIVFSRQEQCDGASDCLIQTRLIPVCAPSLAPAGALSEAEIGTLPLLHVKTANEALDLPGWEDWFKVGGASKLPALGGVLVGSLRLVIEAAELGLGAALVPSHLAASRIAVGRLVSPHDCFLPSTQSHLLVYPQEHRARSTFRAFRTWLLNEARRGGPGLEIIGSESD